MTYALFHENQNPRIAGRRHAGASEHGLAALGLWIPAIPAGMTGCLESLGGHVIPAGIAGIQGPGRAMPVRTTTLSIWGPISH